MKAVRLLIGLAFWIAVAAPAQVKALERVDLELILMADASGSVDEDEFVLQRQGTAQALRDPRIIDAIRHGRLGRIAISYVEWSGPDLQEIIVDWTIIAGAADIALVAHKLETADRRLYGGGTAIGHALAYATRSLHGNGFDGRRLVIDLSGDDSNQDGYAASVGRDHAVDSGVTVNGLAIVEWHPGLDTYFRDQVIGGRGAFVQKALNFKDFGLAMRKKLIREIAGWDDPQDRFASLK